MKQSTTTIPNGWKIDNLENLCEKIADRDHTTPQYVEDGIPIISPKDFIEFSIDFANCEKISQKAHEKNKKKTDLRKGDILFSRIGTIGEVRIVDTSEEFSILHSIVQIRPNENKVINKYLFYYLQSPDIKQQSEIGTQSIGTPDLGIKKIRTFTIRYPKDKELQNRICLILDNIQEMIKKRYETALSLQNLLSSVFIDLFGDPIENQKNWEKLPLFKVAPIERINIKPENIRDGTNFVGLEHIEKETGRILAIKKVKKGELKSSKFHFRASSILYGKLRPYLNKVAFPNFDGVCSTDIMPIHINEEYVTKFYVGFLLKNKSFVSFAKEKSTGDYPRISVDKLERFEIPVPPLVTQNEFTEIVNKCEILQNNIVDIIKNYKKLQENLISEFFNGMKI